MSARAAKPSAPDQAAGPGVVQQLLAERRDLMVANERLRLEIEELRGTPVRADPRVRMLEMENRALRDELAAARAELQDLEEAVQRVVGEMQKASP
jgi:phage terminase Nu1 subunit (DNA packaging protein)